MKQIWSLLLCVALTVSLFSGCNLLEDENAYVPTGDGYAQEDEGNKPPQNQEEEPLSLTLIFYPDKSLNPLKTADYTNRAIMPLLYQSLFSVDRNYNPEPILCKNYTVSSDGRTYVFYIERATFSDGSLLTPNDVVATLLAAKESAYYKGRFTHILEIALTEDGGVKVRTDTAYENLPILLDIPIIKETQLEEDRPLGTGPYMLDDSSDVVRLRMRNNWWCQADMVVDAPSITLMEAESITQIRDEFQFGGLDVAVADPSSDRYADYRCDYELFNCENGVFLYLACSADSPVFSNDTIRQALTYAIDRQSLASGFYRGFAQPATLPASPSSPYYNKGLAQQYGFNKDKFAQAVSDVGMVGREVTLLVNSNDSLRLRAARSIAQMLTDCGLKVTMSELGGSKYVNAVKARNYDLYLGQTKLSPNMDLSEFFATYGNLSYGGINDAAAYALCLEALANRGNYYSLHKTIMENGLLCPVLFHNYAVYATRGLVTDLKPARDNVFYYSLGKTLEEVLIKENPS